jgi:hypothetical protein
LTFRQQSGSARVKKQNFTLAFNIRGYDQAKAKLSQTPGTRWRVAAHKSELQLVIQILDQLEGHPNFVKANRIIDELERAKLISIDEKPRKPVS